MKQLTPMDAQFFYSDAPHQPMVIGGLWICDQSTAPNGLVRHKDIIRFIDSRLSGTSLFRRRLQHAPFRLDDPYWLEDKHFDLEYHIRHVGLPQPGDWRQLCIFTARAMSRSLDMERAPWEITIIEGLNNVEGVPPGSFALLLRFHHAYVDGKSGVEITTLLMDDQVEFDEHTYRQPINAHLPTRTQMWAKTMPRLLSQSLRSAKAGYSVARKSLQLMSQLRGEASPDQSRVPTTLFNAQVSPHRSYGATRWPIAELKQIRRCVEGSTLNDVVIAIIAGGLRRYLLRRESLPTDQSLVALCPVAVRPDSARHDMGNQISVMLIGMGTDLSDPQLRLQAITERTQRAAPLAKDVMHELITSMGEMIPAPMRMLGGWLQNQIRYVSHFQLQNTLITNVPGPTNGSDKKYFAGAEILATYPIGPIFDGMGLCHGITSLYGQIILGVMADRQMLPDMDVYMACLQESRDEYLALAGTREAQAKTENHQPAAPRRRLASPRVAEPGNE